MNNLKIQRTTSPENTMDINEWYEMFKIGSRCSKYTREETGSWLNDQYDFSKLSDNTEAFGFFGSNNILKLVDL